MTSAQVDTLPERLVDGMPEGWQAAQRDYTLHTLIHEAIAEDGYDATRLLLAMILDNWNERPRRRRQ